MTKYYMLFTQQFVYLLYLVYAIYLAICTIYYCLSKTIINYYKIIYN